MPDHTCPLPGCDKTARGKLESVCSKHRARMKRTGTYDARPINYTPRVNTNGYITISVTKDHPFARVSSLIGRRSTTSVWQHRVVLFDEIGYGPHRCHYCDRHLNWGAGLLVDHVDENKQNNQPDNLVPSCNGCNIRRAFTIRRAS